MKTRFALRDEADPRATLVRVGNQAAEDRRTTHLGLLCAFPAIWMAEHELGRFFDGLPEGFAICVGVDDEAAGAAIEVVEKVAKYVHGRFVAGKGAETHSVHVELHGLGAQTKLEPDER